MMSSHDTETPSLAGESVFVACLSEEKGQKPLRKRGNMCRAGEAPREGSVRSRQATDEVCTEGNSLLFLGERVYCKLTGVFRKLYSSHERER